jgi:hypothetical protein
VKERQKVRKGNQPGATLETLPHLDGAKSRDKARAIFDQQAKERMAEGGKQAGRGRPQQGKETLPTPIQSRDQAGKAVGAISGPFLPFLTPFRWVAGLAVAAGRGGTGGTSNGSKFVPEVADKMVTYGALLCNDYIRPLRPLGIIQQRQHGR